MTNGDEMIPGRLREEFGGTELTAMPETASTAVAMQARAATEARYIMALRRPRDMDQVRQDLLKECQRPSFAEVARYHKPIGKGVEGPSIRFAETAIRCMKNMLIETPTIYEDATRRIVRVSVMDLESNNTYHSDISIEKTVERSRLRDGQVALAQRQNSRGEIVYLVEATEDDLLNKQGALISKAMRNLSLRLIPGDLIDEAEELIKKTLRDRAAKDPDAERKRIADAFGALHVTPLQLKAYLGHDLAQCVPAELEELRAIYQTIKDGETTWTSVMEERTRPAEETKTATLRTQEALKEAGRKLKPATTPATTPPAATGADCPCPDGPAGLHLKGCPKAPKDESPAGDDELMS